MLALITWVQRDDPHWFGARIRERTLIRGIRAGRSGSANDELSMACGEGSCARFRAKEFGAYVGGFVGGAAGMTTGVVAATLLLPGVTGNWALAATVQKLSIRGTASQLPLFIVECIGGRGRQIFTLLGAVRLKYAGRTLGSALEIKRDPCWGMVARVFLSTRPSVNAAVHQSVRQIR